MRGSCALEIALIIIIIIYDFFFGVGVTPLFVYGPDRHGLSHGQGVNCTGIFANILGASAIQIKIATPISNTEKNI